MPVPPTLTFDDGAGTILDLNSAEYFYTDFGNTLSAPQLSLDVIRRINRSGVSIPYAAIAEREFTIDIYIDGDSRAESQRRFNRLLQTAFITDGGSQPRFGELRLGLWDDDVLYAIRCAIKSEDHQIDGLGVDGRFTFTTESGLFYNPVRTTLPAATLAVGTDLPELGIDAAFTGDALPWEMGGGYPHVETMIDYGGTAQTYSLEVLIDGPSERPIISRGDIAFKVTDTVPEGTTLFIAMAGPRAELRDSAGAVLANWTGRRTGDSLPIPLIAGGNTLRLEQSNEIDGAYNQVTYSFREEYISTGA